MSKGVCQKCFHRIVCLGGLRSIGSFHHVPQDVPIVAALFAGIRLSLRHIDGQIEWGQHDQISMDVFVPLRLSWLVWYHRTLI